MESGIFSEGRLKGRKINLKQVRRALVNFMKLYSTVWPFPLTIAIMESGIFREGRLKGRKISGKYRLYELVDVEYFVLALTSILNQMEITKQRGQKVAESFDDILRQYDELSKTVLENKGVRPEKVETIRHDLITMKTKTVNKISPVQNLTPNIMPSLIALFKKMYQPPQIKP